MLKQLAHVATLPTIQLGMRVYLLTMVRKSELQDATWDEVDFENAVWTIPKERMKRSKAYNVYLSRRPRHLDRAEDVYRKKTHGIFCRLATTQMRPCRARRLTELPTPLSSAPSKKGYHLSRSRSTTCAGPDRRC